MKEENTYKDILDNPKLRENPYSVPDGYFTDMENKVRDVIAESEVAAPKGFALFKPALMLAVMFVVIGGIGLSALKITEVLYNPDQESPTESLYALIEGGYIEQDFVYQYYMDEVLSERFSDALTIEDIEEYFINSMTVEDIYYHINK